MRAIEFQSQLNSDQTLTIPPSMRGTLTIGQIVRVLILVPDGEPDREWEELAAEEFGKGYADADAIYDQFPAR
jgi:hypothetical protein